MKNKRLIIITITILINIGCDQFTKLIAKNHLQERETIEVVGNFFILKYAENDGAFLSMGSDFHPTVKLIFLSILPLIILVSLLVYTIFKKNIDTSYIIGLSCILGGGFSNIFDRLLNNGRVIDFMNFGIGNIRTGILNIADLSIFTGVLILLFYSIKTNNTKA
jgi:signal peptidase II